MIRLIDNQNKLMPDGFCDNDYFYIKIKSLFEAYGTDTSFLMFYAQINETGETVSLVSLFEGHATLCMSEKSDFDELKEFAAVMAHSCEFDKAFLRDFDLESNHAKEGFILKFCKSANAKKPQNISIKEAYTIQSECNSKELRMPPYDAYYVDMSHRVRHGCAEVFGISEGDETAATVTAANITCDGAIISGVAVLPKYRNRGLGSRLAADSIAYLNSICGKTYLLCSKQLYGFYQKLNPDEAKEYIRMEF